MLAHAEVLEPSPGPGELDLLDASAWQDLPGAMRALRERHPLASIPLISGWSVLRYHDVTRLLGDARLVSGYGGLAEGPSERVMSGLLVNQEGARHTRLRQLVADAFTPRQIERMREAVRIRVNASLAALAPGSRVDFQAAVADPLARQTLCDLLGIPEADAAAFGGWVGTLLVGFGPLAEPSLRAAADAAALNIFAYLEELAARCQREPGDSLVHALLNAAPDVSPQDLERVVMSLLFGGTDTVRSFLGIATWLVLDHPGTLERLRAAPELAAATVEEALRFEPPLSTIPRLAASPLEIAGVEIPAGSRVMLGVVSANRDPRRFPEPDRFEPLRDASGHLGFGRGTHFCVGAALARLQAQELLLALAAEEAPRLALADTPRWAPFVPARRLEALRVEVLSPGCRPPKTT